MNKSKWKKMNVISKRKKPIVIVLAILLILSILLMDFSHLFVQSDPSDQYTFFYDDFAFSTTNSTKLWEGQWDISNGIFILEESQTAWTDFSLAGWNGYTDLILRSKISPLSTSANSRIIIRDANTSEILYSQHPSSIDTQEINLLPYVDLISTHLKIQVVGKVKFTEIWVFTPNLFLNNLLIDDNVEEVFKVGVGASSYLENGQPAQFRPYSRYITFDPGEGTAEYYVETQDYFIPYYSDIALIGLIARMYDEFEDNAYNSSVRFVIKAKFYHGDAVEYETLLDTTEYLDGRPTPINIPLNSLMGMDVAFVIYTIGYSVFDSPSPELALSYLGISAQADPKVNGREIEAVDYATKDVFTQITPAMVSGEEKMVLARDREGTIATYKAFTGTNSSYVSCSNYVLSEYLDEPSNALGAWTADEDGETLTFDLFTGKKGAVSIQKDQLHFTTGSLEAYFSVYEYGVATGIVYKYQSQSEFWAIAVQKIEEQADLALLIHNYAIIDTIPLISNINTEVSIRVIKNSFLDSYRIYVNEQFVFIRSHMTPGSQVGFFYRIVDNTGFGKYYPAQFYGMSLYDIGVYDTTSMYLTVQNPMVGREVTISLKEMYSDESLYVKERKLASFTIPYTRGFETFVVPCIKPSYNTRFKLEMDSDVLVYVSEFGFLGYTAFGSSRQANLYYDIAEPIISDQDGRRVLDEEIVLEDDLPDEWVSYDMQLKEGFFYVYANATTQDNLEILVEIKPINATEFIDYTLMGTIYFLEKDGKNYGHHIFMNSSFLDNFATVQDIFEVRISVNSSVSEEYPVTVYSVATQAVSDQMMADDYSSLPGYVDGWREDWEIDSSIVSYLDQSEWYVDVGFSALNGGPADAWVPFDNSSAIVEENAFYTTLSSEGTSFERFLGFNLDTIDYPFIELKVRSNNITVCNELGLGIHTLSYDNISTTIEISDHWEWYRFNIYQMTAYCYKEEFPNNDPEALTELLVDKLTLEFNGKVDISAIKIYSIASWEYIPSSTDTFYTTAHIEGEQETVFCVGDNTQLFYSVDIDDWANYNGNWSYSLEFMLVNTTAKTTLVSIYDDYNNKFIDTFYVENGLLYSEDFQDDITSLNIDVETNRWYTLYLSSCEFVDTHEYNFSLSLDDQTTGLFYSVPVNGTSLIYELQTTQSEIYLRELAWSSIELSEAFEEGFDFVVKTELGSRRDKWVLIDASSPCKSFLSKIDSGQGGTIASSSNYLVMDEDIKLQYSFSDLSFLTPEDFFFWVTTSVFARNLMIYVNDDFELSSQPIESFFDYQITIDDIGENVNSIELIALDEFVYLEEFHLWGNYSLSDYYTDFMDGNCVLEDWSFPTDAVCVTNTGDLSTTDEHDFNSYLISYYNQYYSDFILSTEVKSTSYYQDPLPPELGGVGDFFHVGLVFLAQQKTVYTFSSFSGYYLEVNVTVTNITSYEAEAEITLYRFDSGIENEIYDCYQDVDISEDFSFGVSVTTSISNVKIELLFNGKSLGRITDNLSPVYSGGYTGAVFYKKVQDLLGIYSSYSVYHKYYYPTSDQLDFGTYNKQNAFVAGSLYVDAAALESETLNLNYQQTLTCVFTIDQTNPNVFFGLYQGEVAYGFKFASGDVYKYTDGTSEKISDNWIKENVGRVMYVTIVFGFEDNSFTMQLFTDRSLRPDVGEPLYIAFNTTFTAPIFKIEKLDAFNYADIIVDSIECGGIYPLEVEFDDGSTTHAIRGSGVLADYYLQATAQGSLKIDSSSAYAYMIRDFYVLANQTTTLSFGYLSTGYHDSPYSVLIINKQSEIYLNASISSTQNDDEEIAIGVDNGQSIENLFTFTVPYYRWIDVSISLNTSLEIEVEISYQGGSFNQSETLSSYMDVNKYYSIKVHKPQHNEDPPLYFKYISVYNGAGFSSSFVVGDFKGWNFNNSNCFEFSHDIDIAPDILTIYAEPLGGWCDFTVLVDDGEYSRTTRLQVEDYETFKPYLVFLPFDLDTTEIHKYTFKVDGILTLYSLSFQQSILVNDWLVTKPVDEQEEEILEQFTQIGYLLEDFEVDIFAYMDIITDPDLGKVGKVTGVQSLFLSNYIPSIYRESDFSVYYCWNGEGTGYDFEIQLTVSNEGHVPSDQVEELDINAIFTPIISDRAGQPIFSHSTIDTQPTPDVTNIYFEFNYVPETWQFVYIDISAIRAYTEQETEDIINISSGWDLRCLNKIVFSHPYSGAEVYIDDLNGYSLYSDESPPSPFAKAYVKSSSLNTETEGVWVPEYVNSLGFLDFTQIADDDIFATEQAAFIVECDKEANVIIHVTTTHPFVLYQGQVIMEQGPTISTGSIMDYYFSLHLYEGLNRFLIRSFHKSGGGFPWQLRVNLMTPTSIRIVTTTDGARDADLLFSSDDSYPISDWLVTDRSIAFGDLDYLKWHSTGPTSGYYDDPYRTLDKLTGHYFATRALPFPGEQLNYTIYSSEYDTNITEFTGFDEFYNATGYMNYVAGNMNTTSIESKDQIIYYTNFHFLEDSPSTNNITIRLNYDPTSLVESIYYDGQYVYGRLGEVGYNDSNHNFYSYISVTEDNGTYILNIQLKNWETFAHDYEYMSAVNSRFDYESEAPNLIDIRGRNKPLNTGIHRFAIVLRCPTGLSSIPSNLFDIKAKLSNYDDSINTFTQITEYITTKQKLDEKAPMMQTDGEYRSTPSAGLQSGKQSYAGKKVLDSAITWDGFRYHSMRFVMIGVDQYDIYEDMDGDQDEDYDDAVGLATYMVVNDAGTKHETSTIIQHMIGPAGNSSEQQPSKLCPRYSMTSLNLESLLFDSSNIRLSHDKTNSNSAVPLNLNLQFSKEQLSSVYLSTSDYSNSSLTEQSFLDFVNSVLSDVTIEFSLSGTLVISSSNDTIFLDADRLTLYLEEYSFSFDKFLQKMSISYSDGRDQEKITIHLMTHIVTHTDSMALHTSYHKIGQYNGFTIYDYVKIRNIAQGLITPPQHVNLGLFSSISTSLRAIKGAFFTVVGAVEGTLDKFTCRFDSFREKVSTWFDNAAQSIQNTMAYIGNIVSEFVDKLIVMVNNVVTLITDAITECLEGLVEFLIYVMENPELFYNRCRNPFKNFLAKARAWFSNVFKKVGNFFKIVGKALKDFFKMIGQIYLKILKFQASMFADMFRIQLLFIFSLIFGTNVGLHQTDEVAYLNGQKVFSNETALKYPQVYKLDHVLDLIAGRTDLDGELTEAGIKQGMADDVEPSKITSILVDIGCEIFEKLEGEDVVFGDFKWVHSAEVDGQWDHFFGLRKRLRLFGLPLFSENTFIMICEIVLGILPVTGLVQDCKDAILEPMKFFRIFASIMIPLDLIEIFGSPLGQMFGGLQDYCAGRGIGKILGGIKDAISTLLEWLWNACKFVFKIIGEATKILLILGTAILGMVTAVLLPAVALPIFGIGTVFVLIYGFISFMGKGFKKLLKKCKPLIDSMKRTIVPAIRDFGAKAKEMWSKVAKKTEVIRKKISEIGSKIEEGVSKIWGMLWDKICKTWDELNWKPWKNSAMPWCAACLSKFAKENLQNIFDAVGENAQVAQKTWLQIFHLKPSSYADLFNLDGTVKEGFEHVVESIDECVRVLYPGSTTDEIFGITDEAFAAEFAEKWGKATGEFFRFFTKASGSDVATTILAKNLDDIVDELNIPLKDGEHLGNILHTNPKRANELLGQGFEGSKYNEVIDKLKKFYVDQSDIKLGKLNDKVSGVNIEKFVDPLTDQEAEVYAKYLLGMSGINVKIEPSMEHEIFMQAWAKIHVDKDILRQAWKEGTDIDEVLLKNIKKAVNAPGFDDINLYKTIDGKYVFNIFELKAQGAYRNFRKRFKNGGDLLFNDEILDNINDIAKKFIDELDLKAIGVSDECLDDFVEKFRRYYLMKYQFVQTGTGNEFLFKLNTGDLETILKNIDGLTDAEVKSIMNGAIKQNQLIGLVQNGNTYTCYYDDVAGVWRLNEAVTDSIVIDIRLADETVVKGFTITSATFQPKIIDGKIDIPRLTPSSPAADRINSILDSVITGDLSEITVEMIDNPKLLVNRMVEIQQKVLDKLNCEGVFPEIADVFDGNSMNFFIETAADFDGPLGYIKRWCEGFSAQPYTGAQHWGLPFNNAIARLGARGEGGMKGLIDMIANNKISKMPLDIDNLDDWEDLIDEDEFAGGLSFLKACLKAEEQPFKLLGQPYWTNEGWENPKYAFFYDTELEPMRITGEGAGCGNPMPRLEFEWLKFFECAEKNGQPMSRWVMMNPFHVKVTSGRNPAIRLFGSSNTDAQAKAWKKLLKARGYDESFINAVFENLGEEGLSIRRQGSRWEDSVLLLVIMLHEYKRNWDEFARYIQEGIKGTGEVALRWEGVTEEVIENFKVGLDGTIKYGEEQVRIGIGAWHKGLQNPFLLPGHNNLFRRYLGKIEKEICELIFQFPNKKEFKDILEWITMNWRRTFKETWDDVKG